MPGYRVVHGVIFQRGTFIQTPMSAMVCSCASLLSPVLTRRIGIFEGESTLLLGCGYDDDEGDGLKVEVRAGDVIVLPAGTAHCNLESSKGFRYVGVYPKGAPKWRNEYGKDEGEIGILREEASTVAVPNQDPVNGVDGPLLRLWT